MYKQNEQINAMINDMIRDSSLIMFEDRIGKSAIYSNEYIIDYEDLKDSFDEQQNSRTAERFWNLFYKTRN